MDLQLERECVEVKLIKAMVLADESSKEKKVFCLLCKKVYQEPYVTSCGHTFCRNCVSDDKETLCPMDGTTLSLLVKNLVVAEEVAELRIHCQFGCVPKDDTSGEFVIDPQGCPVIVKLGGRLEHEKNCDFAPTVCPNSSLCPSILRKHLQEHLKLCGRARCVNFKYSCQFEGTKEQQDMHLETCKFGGLEGVVGKLESDFVCVAKQIDDHTTAIKSVSSTLEMTTTELGEISVSCRHSSQRIARLEEQQSFMLKELTSIKNSVSAMLTELSNVQQQLGIGANMEAQHLFKCQGTFVGHKGPVWALCKSDDLLFSASSDNTIKVWNLSETYTGPNTIVGHDGIILTLCCKGGKLFSGSSDSVIKVWNIKSLKEVASFQAHTDPVCTLACNDSYVFSGSLRSIKVWNISSYELRVSLPTQNHWVRALVVRGELLYSGSYKAVKIWNIDTFEVAHVLNCAGGSVYSLAITEKYIICGTYENTIHVWDVKHHSEVGTLSGHVGSIYGLAVLNTPGRVRLFSGSYDKTIRVWNLELMTCAQTLARHEGSVTCLLAFRGTVFSAAVDSTLKVWR